jgi:hypothetical protein
LPADPWGPSRLDAVAMIFNRLTGLDLGPPPHYLIPDNVRIADAPVRYPSLWNAAIQDLTQWPGFAENGNDPRPGAEVQLHIAHGYGTTLPADEKRALLQYLKTL